MSIPLNQIIQGDSLEELRRIPDGSVDLVCTDSPYGYGFMGKDWDRSVPSAEVWKECLRVLKPGAFAFVMSAPRSDVLSRMIVRIEDAGFRTDFTPIYWTYASGFPKAMNIGKIVDKRGAVNPDELRSFKEWFKKQIEKSPKTQKQINDECGFTATSYCKTDGKDYWTSAFPTEDKWQTIKLVLSLENEWDSLIKRYDKERGYLKTPTGGLSQSNTTPFTGKQLNPQPYSPQAKALDGSYGGFQPKPAVEVVIVAMKPLSEKTYVDQALKNGKGITWLDDGRIPTSESLSFGSRQIGDGKIYGTCEPDDGGFQHQNGRFPANLLVEDDVLNDGVIRTTGNVKPYISKSNGYSGGYGLNRDNPHKGDSGSFSRYFSLDEWAKTFPFLIVPKAAKSEKNRGTDGSNNHPTVKPLKLVSYLITLGSRPGDTVLDPFLGSGTTAVAAKELKRNYVGIEISPEYCEIARKRVEAVAPPLFA